MLAGTGRGSDTTVSDAARSLNHSRDCLEEAHHIASAPGTRRRDRRAAARSLDTLTTAHDFAEQHWGQIGQPIADKLRNSIRIREARRELNRLDSQVLIQLLDELPIGEAGAYEPAVGIEL